MDAFQRRRIEMLLTDDVSDEEFWDDVSRDEDEGDDLIQVSDHETDTEQSRYCDIDNDTPHDITVVFDKTSYHDSDDD